MTLERNPSKKKQRTDTKKDAKRIKSDNFTSCNYYFLYRNIGLFYIASYKAMALNFVHFIFGIISLLLSLIALPKVIVHRPIVAIVVALSRS